jgi:hypothetical protein
MDGTTTEMEMPPLLWNTTILKLECIFTQLLLTILNPVLFSILSLFMDIKPYIEELSLSTNSTDLLISKEINIMSH